MVTVNLREDSLTALSTAGTVPHAAVQGPGGEPHLRPAAPAGAGQPPAGVPVPPLQQEEHLQPERVPEAGEAALVRGRAAAGLLGVPDPPPGHAAGGGAVVCITQ